MQTIHSKEDKVEVQKVLEGQQGWVGQQEEDKGHNASHAYGIASTGIFYRALW